MCLRCTGTSTCSSTRTRRTHRGGRVGLLTAHRTCSWEVVWATGSYNIDETEELVAGRSVGGRPGATSSGGAHPARERPPRRCGGRPFPRSAVAVVGPSRSTEDERQSVTPGVGSGDVPGDVDVLVGHDRDRVERVDVLGQPVHDRFVVVLGLERPEQSVPDDQDAAVIAVEVPAVAAVARGGATQCEPTLRTVRAWERPSSGSRTGRSG